MGIPVKLEVFEGPLDLLLHLIDKNKVNIYDIPIVTITEQYMAYIDEMNARNLDVMSEFLVMAATLLNIKSRMLLPKDPKVEEEEEDPRQELVERLLEYKLYKFMSYELKDKQLDAARVVYREPNIPKEIKNVKDEVDLNQLLSNLTLSKLHAVYDSIIRRQVDKVDPIRSKFGDIKKEEFSLEDKMHDIEAYGKMHGTFSFRSLLEEQSTKMEVIVTFLGILELIKVGSLCILQEEIFEDIRITYVDRSKESGD